MLADWFETPKGGYVLAWERGQFDAAVEDVFGYNAVQLGLPGIDFLRESRIPLKVRAGLEPGCALRSEPVRLPLESQSIDLLALPHVLEFSAQPHAILREAERVLMPEGSIVISGFNPLSLWGAARALRRERRQVPWCGRFIGLLRLKDWLALLGFELTGGRFGCYAPPFSQRPCQIEVYTDSQYVQKGISEWLLDWKRRGWRTADKKPVKNVDLWRELDRLAGLHRIAWHWVKGHSGHPENERADALANRGVEELSP